MPKNSVLKKGKVVICLQGKYAGHKAVIVRTYDNGTQDRKYGHAIVAGIARYPQKVNKRMSKKKIAKRSRVKPFVKAVNYTHVMPTRYGIGERETEKELGKIVTARSLAPSKRRRTRKQVSAVFQERYTAGKNQWFFTKLRF